jgi:hypothetical protein
MMMIGDHAAEMDDVELVDGAHQRKDGNAW